MEELIINLYQSGISITKLSNQFNIPYNKVSLILKENNVNVVDRQTYKYQKEYSKIIDLYQQGLSLTQIAKILNLDRKRISKHLKSLNIPVINRHNLCKFNEHIFDSIDSEEKAYWLGFLYADGNLSKSSHTIELSLKASDKQHLIKFKDFLQFNQDKQLSYRTSKLGNSYRISFCNTNTWTVLNNYGCVPKKSLILKFPDETIFKSKDLIRHFIRGYFDGDGCITYNKYTKVVVPHCTMLSTFEFLNTVKLLLKEYDIETIVKPTHPGSDKNTAVLLMKLVECEKFLDFLYRNCSIYLDRKYARYLFFRDSCRSFKELNELLASEIGEGCNVNPEVN